MIEEVTLFNTINLVDEALKEIKDREPAAGYKVAFSGGKDSMVLRDLFKRANVKHVCYFNPTTVDPPELLRFIKENCKDVVWNKPKTSMYALIVKNLMPPTRRIRFCCEQLKERADKCDSGVTAIGIRAAESHNRAKRKLFEASRIKPQMFYFSPMIRWSDKNVWDYTLNNNIPHCCLYDEGQKRIGCICCPMQHCDKMEKDAKRWPRHAAIYMAAFAECIKRIKNGERKNEYNGKHLKWNSAEDMWNWWLYHDKGKEEKDDTALLFE